MKVGVVVGVRGSLHTIREWVEHYVNLGFDKVIIYDNNTDCDVMEYLQGLEGHIICTKGNNRQLQTYNEAYRTYRNEFDWLAFFDDDEWLVLKKDRDIKSYLSRDIFRKADCLHINWKIYGDNGHLHPTGEPTFEQFPEPCDLNVRTTYKIPQNFHIKSIVRCGKTIQFINPHFCIPNSLICLNDKGDRVSNGPFAEYDYELAELRHYQLRSTEEFCRKRLGGRSDVMYDGIPIVVKNEIDWYFTYNERTPEKEELIKGYLEGKWK